jgi:hypothetical protein
VSVQPKSVQPKSVQPKSVQPKSVQPVLPQSAAVRGEAACGEFVRPTQFPRSFAAFDWCPRCGQPDWAHQAGSGDRIARFRSLDPERMSAMLQSLCQYSPGLFDLLLDQVLADDVSPGRPGTTAAQDTMAHPPAASTGDAA